MKQLLIASLALCLSTGAASAATILNISGPDGGATNIGANVSNDGVSQSFTALQDIADPTISFDVSFCSACAGSFTVMTGMPNPGALLADFFYDEDYSGYASGSLLSFDLSGLTFQANQLYSMIFTITSGNGRWDATRDPVIGGTGDATVTNGYKVLTDLSQNVLRSPTEDFFGATLQFTLSGTVAAASNPEDPISSVPLPAAGWMLLGALAGLVTLRRRQSISA